MSVGTNVEVGHHFHASRSNNLQSHIWRPLWLSSHAVGKGLVEIKEKELLDAFVLLGELDLDLAVYHFLLWDGVHILDEVDTRENVDGELTDHAAL